LQSFAFEMAHLRKHAKWLAWSLISFFSIAFLCDELCSYGIIYSDHDEIVQSLTTSHQDEHDHGVIEHVNNHDSQKPGHHKSLSSSLAGSIAIESQEECCSDLCQAFNKSLFLKNSEKVVFNRILFKDYNQGILPTTSFSSIVKDVAKYAYAYTKPPPLRSSFSLIIMIHFFLN